MKKIVLFLTLGIINTLLAQEFSDTFKFKIGGYLISDNDTTLSATTPYLVGARVNLQDDLGMDTTVNTIRLDGHYRFNAAHKLEFSYYRINTDSTNTINKDIEWNGKVYQSGATIGSYLHMDIYKLNYAYSFYHNEKVELALAAGVHMMDIQTGLSGSATVNGMPSSVQEGNVNVLAPLPVIGFDLNYAVTPRFNINGSMDYFGLSIDQFSGSFTDFLINAEYQVLDNVGVGAGLNVTSLDVEVDKDTKYEANQNTSGFLLYLSFNY